MECPRKLSSLTFDTSMGKLPRSRPMRKGSGTGKIQELRVFFVGITLWDVVLLKDDGSLRFGSRAKRKSLEGLEPE